MSKSVFVIALFVIFALSSFSTAQTTEFTYQGQLTSGAAAANGNFDFEFALFDGGGTQVGSTLTRAGVAVANGVFTVNLDFGANFPGTVRLLEIRVRPAGGGAFTTLSPRQPLTSTPYAVRSLSAGSADNASQLGGTPANQYLQAGNAVLNQTTQQAGANFNISGTGTANIFNAATQFNIGESRVLSIAGTNNLFAGVTAGTAITTGSHNAFFGSGAGASNTTGTNNSIIGSFAGTINTTGNDNSFLGRFAGTSNSTGSSNSFVGSGAGASNTTGNDNSFFGKSAGGGNTTGSNNSIFGSGAGTSTTTGNDNSFFGKLAGVLNSTGNSNSFFGTNAGFSNATGNGNVFVGGSAGFNNTAGGGNAFVGLNAGLVNTSGASNAVFGSSAGFNNSTGGNNAFFGAQAGVTNSTGSRNTAIGSSADVASGALTFASAFGANAVVAASDTIVIGKVAGNYNSVSRPADSVQIPGSLAVASTVSVSTLGTEGATDVCRNAGNQLSTCSSSLRYKTHVRPFSGGLDVVRALRPITFNWKTSGMADLGFGAEDVAKIAPLLAVYNDKGEVEGVKYRQLTAVLVNAVNELRMQIRKLEVQSKQQNILRSPDGATCKALSIDNSGGIVLTPVACH